MSALNSTLLTGLSGLVANQEELNVVGNNIANSNTTAFKSSQIQFSPQFYVTESTGSPATGTSGGSNPSQIGLGVQTAQISQNLSQGELQTTGVSSDLAIQGQGYFVLQNSDNTTLYTRDGAFSLNEKNQLVDSSGDFVQGYGVNTNNFQLETNLAPITIRLGQQNVAQATANASLTGILDTGGTIASQPTVLNSAALQTVGGGSIDGTTPLTNLENFDGTGTTPLYNVGDTITLSAQQGGRNLTIQPYTVTANSTVSDLENYFQSALAISPLPTGSADPDTPGVSITTAAGGGQQLTITGNIGADNALTITGLTTSNSDTGVSLTQTTANDGGESTHTTTTVYDSLGNPVTLDVNTVLTGTSNGSTWEFYVTSPQNQGGSPVVGSGTLQFNSSGQLTSATGNTVTLNRTGTGASASQPITLNFGDVQALSTTNGATPEVNVSSQDGFALGTLNSYSVGTDGIITGSFSNGLTETVGQVALATFSNPAGLVNQGNNQYTPGAGSGTATIVTPGTQGSGTIASGQLEMSNVDLSQEFINLIVASTGYNASSRVISTSDQLLTALLNSSR